MSINISRQITLKFLYIFIWWKYKTRCISIKLFIYSQDNKYFNGLIYSFNLKILVSFSLIYSSMVWSARFYNFDKLSLSTYYCNTRWTENGNPFLILCIFPLPIVILNFFDNFLHYTVNFLHIFGYTWKFMLTNFVFYINSNNPLCVCFIVSDAYVLNLANSMDPNVLR